MAEKPASGTNAPSALQLAGTIARRIIVSHVQRLGDLAFDGLGGFQAQHKPFGLAAGSVEFFVGGSAGDGVQEFNGVRAYTFGQGDLVDGHGGTFKNEVGSACNHCRDEHGKPAGEERGRFRLMPVS